MAMLLKKSDLCVRHVALTLPPHTHPTRPCADCPFKREGGIRLRMGRHREIVESNSLFYCHKTIDHNDEGEGLARNDSETCAGWLIFLLKQGHGGQMFRILDRLGMIDEPALMKHEGLVFDDLDEMEATSE